MSVLFTLTQTNAGALSDTHVCLSEIHIYKNNLHIDSYEFQYACLCRRNPGGYHFF